MRLLVLTNLYPPQALGGYEMSCADVMARFLDRGHEVTILTTDTRLPGVADVAQTTVHRRLRWYWDDHRLVTPSASVRLDIERHNRRTLVDMVAGTRPDVVSVWAMGAMSLGMIDVLNETGLPVVYVVCDEWPVYGPRLDAWLAAFRPRRRRPLSPVVRILTGLPTTLPRPRQATFCWLTRFIRDTCLHATTWEPAHETITYSGIDPGDFPLAPSLERPWRGRLLCVGRVEPRKGFATAVGALPLLPGMTLRIVGPEDGTHAADLTRLAERLGVADRLSFDRVPRARLREEYAAADVLLFTSAWQEPFGLVPVEAMACATPVVAAATGGAREFLVDGANCLVVPAGDSGAVAASVDRLASDAQLRARLVDGGTATAAALSVDALADVMERWHLAAADGFATGEPAHRPAAIVHP